MKELLEQIKLWAVENKPMVLARVIQTWGSSPRPVGSAMLISSDLEMAGSVSGGCVEGAVVKESKLILGGKKGKRLFYGVADDDAWAVGLNCGGEIRIYLQPWSQRNEVQERLTQCLSENKSCILVSSLNDGESKNALITSDERKFGDEIPEEVFIKAKEAFEKRKHDLLTVGETQYFIHVFPKRSQLLIIGAAHITSHLVQLAHEFDFETIVIDPRSLFSKNTTYSVKPDQVIEKYPSEVLNEFELGPYTYAVILSHDSKIDDDALQILLKSNVAYIGAIGSKKNHAKRTERLLGMGFTTDDIARIDAPIGIDIKAQGAKEIALSIMGALIKTKNAYL
ncbi:MAG TPA: XdhC family protein [Cyclobacteriaceae bacterium]|jgi:xanthine dehydrogenase accessory factor|nr:XdhC family protein [Cyclobacteriaceae bacterium]